jgi:hypothetical protein
LTLAGSALSDMQPVRRELVRQVIALDPLIDQAIGESSRLYYHSQVLQVTKDSLFEALAGWSAVVWRLARLPDDAARQQADAVLDCVPLELRSAPSRDGTTPWVTGPTGMRRLCDTAVRRLIAMPAGTPSLRLIADQTALLLAGLSDVLDGLALLAADPARHQSRGRHARPHVPDWLPALVNNSSMNSRARSRTAVSIGSNQSSKSWGAVSPLHCGECVFVILLVMAWSPIRRSNAG